VHFLPDATDKRLAGSKARAVVDAMERDMATTIATRADLQRMEQKLFVALTLT
jgi:hypothetical protein